MRTISILVTLLLLVSCKSPSYLTKPKDFKYHVKGLYFETEIVKNFKIIGEIIEVNDNEIKILLLLRREPDFIQNSGHWNT